MGGGGGYALCERVVLACSFLFLLCTVREIPLCFGAAHLPGPPTPISEHDELKPIGGVHTLFHVILSECRVTPGVNALEEPKPISRL